MQHAKQPTRRLKKTQTTALMKRMVALLCVATLVLSTPLQSLAYDIAAAEELGLTASESAEDAATSEDGADSSAESESTADDADATEDSSDAATEDAAEATEDTDTNGTTDSTDSAADTSSDATTTEDTSTSSTSTSDTTNATSDAAAIIAEIAALVSSISPLSFGTSLLTTGPTASDTASVSSLSITNIVDGTENFNDDDSDGNDSTGNNGRVRTFDTVTYMLSYAITGHNGGAISSDGTYYLYFEFIIPLSSTEAEWDTSVLSWATNYAITSDASVSYDFDGDGSIEQNVTCQIVRGYRTVTLSSADAATNSEENLEAAVLVLNSAKGTEIAPVFTMWVAGNCAASTAFTNNLEVSSSAAPCVTENTTQCSEHNTVEQATVAANQDYVDGKGYGSSGVAYDYAVTVTCEPRYNIKITQAYSGLNMIDTFDFNTGNTYALDMNAGSSVTGYLTAYGVTIQLYNDEKYGLKGVEVPTGAISFDITLSTVYVVGSNSEDVTNTYTPLVYTWGPNESGSYDGRDVSILIASYAQIAAPFNSGMTRFSSSGSTQAHDGGTWTATKSSATISVTVSGYEIEYPLFPNANAGNASSVTTYFDPTEGAESISVGSFSAGKFFIVTPFYSNTDGTYVADEYGEGSFQTTVALNSSSVTVGGTSVTDQYDGDNTATSTAVLSADASTSWRIAWSQYGRTPDTTSSQFYDVLGRGYSASGDSWGTTGEDALALGSNLAIAVAVNNNENADSSNRLYAANILCKFDARAVTLTGDEYVPSDLETYGYEVEILYATKTDGSHWAGEDEMLNAKIEDLAYYSSLDAASAAGVVVAYLVEVRPKEGMTPQSFSYGGALIPVSVGATVNEDTTLAGSTYQCVIAGQTWRLNEWNTVGQSVPSMAGHNVNGTTVSLSGASETYYPTSYTKTEYESDGTVITGTIGQTIGDTLLIQEATPSITKTEDSDSSTYNSVYHIDQGDSTVSYKLTPSFASSTYSSPYETTLSTVTITDTLPEGMEYIAGSAKTETNETANPTITTNQNGTTTLTWIFTNVSTTADMDQYTITYEAEISGEVDNNEELENTATITYDGTLDSRSDDDLRAASTTVGNMSQVTVTASKLAGLTLYKKADEAAYEVTDTVSYTLNVANTSQTTATNTLILDVLPYDGDGNSTITAGSTITLSEVGIPTGWTAYYTTDAVSAADADALTASDVRSSSDWTQLNTTTIPATATAIAWIGTLAATSGSFEATVSLNVSGMSAGDVLANTMYYKSDTTNGTYSSLARAYIASRTISGLAWLDSDENNIRGAGDTVLSGIKVTLLQLKNGSYVPLQDANESDVDVSVTTGSVSSSDYIVYSNNVRYKVTAAVLADGSYEFSGLPAGTYAVKFEGTSSNSLAKYVACEVGVGGSDYVDSDAAPTYSDSSSVSSESNQLVSTQITDIDMPATIQAPTYISANNDSGFYYKKGSITITKTNTDGATLQGAVFKIMRSTDGSNWEDITSDYSSSSNYSSEYGGLVTGTSGTIKFDNLTQGYQYKVTEIYAASGYALSGSVIIDGLPAQTVAGSDSNYYIGTDTQSNTFTENGTTYTLNVSLKDTVATGKGLTIPFTGSSPLNALLMCAVGIALMALAAYALYRQRRGMRTCAAHTASAQHASASSPYASYVPLSQVLKSRPYASRASMQQARASRPRPTRRRVR